MQPDPHKVNMIRKIQKYGIYFNALRIIGMISILIIAICPCSSQDNDIRLGDDYETVLSKIRHDDLYKCCTKVEQYANKIVVLHFMSMDLGATFKCTRVSEFTFGND